MITIRRPYIHFKGGLYYIHDLIHNPHTQKTSVSYQALYPPYAMYVEPIEMFLKEINPNDKNNIFNQNCRFEIYTEKQNIQNNVKEEFLCVESKLKYPEGSFIKWFDEYYKVIKNIADCSGIVMDMNGDTYKEFYFDYSEGRIDAVTDKNKISKLDAHLKALVGKVK